MKNVAFLFVFPAFLVSLSACEDKDRFAEAAFRYRVDSTVNARLDQLQSQLQKRNDSLILEAAKKRAGALRKERSFQPARTVQPVAPLPVDSSTPPKAAL